MLAYCTLSKSCEVQLTLSVVGEVELRAVAAVERRVRRGVFNARVCQPIGIGVREEVCDQVDGVVGLDGNLGGPGAYGIGAGKHGGGSAGCESENDGGELHDDGCW
jgi:hypothetical protein